MELLVAPEGHRQTWQSCAQCCARRAERPVAQHRPAPGQHHGERNPVNSEEPIALTGLLIGVDDDRAQALFDQDFPRPPPQIPHAVGGDASETDQQWRFASLQEVLDVLAEQGRRIRVEPLAGDMNMRPPGRVRRVEAGAELVDGLRRPAQDAAPQSETTPPGLHHRPHGPGHHGVGQTVHENSTSSSVEVAGIHQAVGPARFSRINLHAHARHALGGAQEACDLTELVVHDDVDPGHGTLQHLEDGRIAQHLPHTPHGVQHAL